MNYDKIKRSGILFLLGIGAITSLSCNDNDNGCLLYTSLQAYVTGQNLFTLTKYKGYDPEVNAFGGDSVAQGVDLSLIHI